MEHRYPPWRSSYVCTVFFFSSLLNATFEWGPGRRLISQVFVVVLILRDHLLQKEDEDRRETAVFQEEPSRTVFPPDIHLVRGYIQVLSQFHKITAQGGLINRNTNPKQDLACVQLLSNFILQYDLLLMHNFARKEINYLCNLGHLQKGATGCRSSTTRRVIANWKRGWARAGWPGRTPQLNRKKWPQRLNRVRVWE